MILWPLLVVTIFVVGFAEMFYTFSQVDCVKGMSDISVCRLRDAYRLVYFLAVGEPIVEIDNDDDMATGMTVLVVLFLTLGVLLLLGILVVVMVGASKYDSESIALDSFWEPKLAFVLSSQDTRAAAAARQKKVMHMPQPSCMDRFMMQLEHLWTLNVCFLRGRDARNEELWYKHLNSTSFCSTVFLRLWAAFFLPLWIILGLATMGLLWPPQIRRFIFQPWGVISDNKSSPSEATSLVASQVSDVKNEVLKLKDMNFERSNDIEREIQELKAMIMALKE